MKKILARKIYRKFDSGEEFDSLLKEYAESEAGLAAGCSLYWKYLSLFALAFALVLFFIFSILKDPILFNVVLFALLVVSVTLYKHLSWSISEGLLTFKWFNIKKEVEITDIESIKMDVMPSRFRLALKNGSSSVNVYSIELKPLAELHNALKARMNNLHSE